MAFDGIITKSIIHELNKNILNLNIEKINVPNKNEIIITFHGNKQKHKLLISINPTNARIQLTKLQKENPAKALQFCMVLRKHLQGSKLINILQHGCDRIIEFSFETLNDFGDLIIEKLIVELMGKHSNIILVNSNNKIIDSIKYVDASMSSIREVLPAREYSYPENQFKTNFEGISLEEFNANIAMSYMVPSSTDVPFYIQLANTFEGFSRPFTKIICDKLNIENDLTKQKINSLYLELTKILYSIPQGFITLKKYNNDYHIDIYNHTASDSTTPLSDFLDNFYYEKESNETLNNNKLQLQKEIQSIKSKYEKNLSRVKEILSKQESMEKYKQYGELISSNIYRMKIGMKEVTLENFYDNNNKITIPLNESYSPARNAQNYFKKYSKLKNSISHSLAQEKEYLENINYLEDTLYSLSECTTINEINEIKDELIKEKYIKESKQQKNKRAIEKSMPHKYEINGTTILVGKNNTQNDRLTLKESKKTYTWLHTKNVHGSHVIIQSDKVSDEILLYAARLAVKHSQAKNSTKVEVDYTLVKNVHKPAGAKPGMVIYTDYKTIII